MPLTDFYREFVMSRGHFNPRDFGVDMDRDKFMEFAVDDLNAAYKGTWSIDELVLHPREAAIFYDGVRHARDWRYIPDAIILQRVMNRRK